MRAPRWALALTATGIVGAGTMALVLPGSALADAGAPADDATRYTLSARGDAFFFQVDGDEIPASPKNDAGSATASVQTTNSGGSKAFAGTPYYGNTVQTLPGTINGVPNQFGAEQLQIPFAQLPGYVAVNSTSDKNKAAEEGQYYRVAAEALPTSGKASSSLRRAGRATGPEPAAVGDGRDQERGLERHRVGVRQLAGHRVRPAGDRQLDRTGLDQPGRGSGTEDREQDLRSLLRQRSGVRLRPERLQVRRPGAVQRGRHQAGQRGAQGGEHPAGAGTGRQGADRQRRHPLHHRRPDGHHDAGQPVGCRQVHLHLHRRPREHRCRRCQARLLLEQRRREVEHQHRHRVGRRDELCTGEGRTPRPRRASTATRPRASPSRPRPPRPRSRRSPRTASSTRRSLLRRPPPTPRSQRPTTPSRCGRWASSRRHR